MEASYFLLNGSSGREDVQLMGGVFGVYPVMSAWFQENTSAFSINACCNWAFSSSVRRELA